MKLREQIKGVLLNIENELQDDLKQLELVADNHTIGFSEWMHSNTVFIGNGLYITILKPNTHLNISELLTIFKQTL